MESRRPLAVLELLQHLWGLLKFRGGKECPIAKQVGEIFLLLDAHRRTAEPSPAPPLVSPRHAELPTPIGLGD